MSTILYGIHCTLFCAPTYTCTQYRLKDPFLCALYSLCATLSDVSAVIPSDVAWEAVLSLLEDLHNEFKCNWNLQCCSPLYVSDRSFSIGAVQ